MPASAPMTLPEKILALKAKKAHVRPGEIVEVPVDVAMAHEACEQLIRPFEQMGATEVWDRNKIVIPIDHWVPASSESSARMHNNIRKFVQKHDLPHFYDVGRQGICHQILVEEGFVLPGDLVTGTDSHTNMAGALGAFACGIGPTEQAAVFATGEVWLKVPETIRVDVTGNLTFPVSGKDIILDALRQLTTEGGAYKAIEFGGSAIENLEMYQRLTLSNMTTELGAKAGIIAPDAETFRYLAALPEIKNGRAAHVRDHADLRPDAGARYERTITIDGDRLEPLVAAPQSPDNVHKVKDTDSGHVDQVFIGSCTNARLEDLRVAASILKGHKVHKGTRLVVFPASTRIYLAALREGIVETITMAGGSFNTSSCGACFGGMGGVLDAGEVCVSTSNRNFPGRMGHIKSKSYLVSPATAAATAIQGKLTDPRTLVSETDARKLAAEARKPFVLPALP
ncbi:MAG: 3-isopropylmalate/(R)-2-methylmalate dehydratase large subunit [Thermoplasmata archaeon]|jgi:3-isopropylmalate/(R)-2-methylmalate dehydratase large subunit|nr:3-isopropylmalate/(R)-2-methylmalate dehydratase large subunit [Thermoplasmata archaeon]